MKENIQDKPALNENTMPQPNQQQSTDQIFSSRNIMNEMIINPSKKKNIKAFIIALIICFVSLAISMAIYNDDKTVGFLGIAIFGFLIIYMIKQRITGKIDSIYFSNEKFKTNFPYSKKEFAVPWTAIENAWIQKIQNTKLLYLSLKNPDQFPEIRDNGQISNAIYKSIYSSLKPLAVNMRSLEDAIPEKYNLCLTDVYELPLEEIETKIKERINKQ
jgi:hypothetical protein